MKKLFLFLAVFIPAVTAYPLSNDTDQFKELLVQNSLLPGTAQFELGNDSLGWLSMASWPLLLGGNILALWGLLDIPIDNSHLYVQTNGKNYFWYNEAYQNNPRKWAVYTGLLVSELGALLASYSQFDARRELNIRYEFSGGLNTTNGLLPYSLPDLLAAPWQPEHVFSTGLFPVLPLLIAAGYSINDWQKIGSFLTNSSVRFMGASVHPAAGLCLALASALALNSLVAPYEELTSRGIGLMQGGETRSSLEFGAVHMANALLPNISLEDTIQQTLFAALFGFYAARYTVDNGYDIRRMIAFHFWWNVTAMTLSYMADPDAGLYMSIRVPVRF